MSERPLHAIVHSARTFGYLLACLMLTQMDSLSLHLSAWLVFLLIYPPLLNAFVLRSGGDHRAIRASMLIDAVVVGLLISLMGFNLEASIVLSTLMGISVLILGGPALLLLTLPLTASGAVSGLLNHPDTYSGDAGFYFVGFAALVAYIGFVGLQVYQETRRLKIETRREQGVRQSLEALSRFCAPFVPPALRSRLKERGARQRRLTVMFVDIHDFESIADRQPSETCRRFLSDYMELVSEVVERRGGTLDKFVGQTAMIFTGDPLTEGAEADARRCLAIALEVRSGCDAALRRYFGCSEALRIGLHTGWCLVGPVGGRHRRDYTAYGSTVALGRRLSSAAAPGEILMSAATLHLVSGAVRFSRRGCVYRHRGQQMTESFAVLEERAPVCSRFERVAGRQQNRPVEVLPRGLHV